MKNTHDTNKAKKPSHHAKREALIAILAIWCRAQNSTLPDLPMRVLQGLINEVATSF